MFALNYFIIDYVYQPIVDFFSRNFGIEKYQLITYIMIGNITLLVIFMVFSFMYKPMDEFLVSILLCFFMATTYYIVINHIRSIPINQAAIEFFRSHPNSVFLRYFLMMPIIFNTTIYLLIGKAFSLATVLTLFIFVSCHFILGCGVGPGRKVKSKIPTLANFGI